MTTEISEDAGRQNSLALELTEMGLSLFVCDSDVPVECIAHVALDDPDFSKKLSAFRAAAETSVGKGFETQIWLPDDQVLFRTLKLDEEADDARQAATSALSASTPFQGDALCFDLGDTNGAGYTPIAAIPKEKMEEAMAFARKMRLNPRVITTSNVVAGFSARPKFAAYAPSTADRPAPLRMAAVAMMLAAPIFLLSADIDRGPGSSGNEGHAFVASIEAFEVETSAPNRVEADPSDVIHQFGEAVPTEQGSVDLNTGGAGKKRPSSPELGSTAVAPQTALGAKWDVSGPLTPSLDVELPASNVAVAITAVPSLINAENGFSDTAEIVAQVVMFEPAYVSVVSADILISAQTGFHDIQAILPIAVFEPGPDDAPSVATLSVEYVQNVFDGNIEIHDLMAVDEVSADAFATPEKAPPFRRLANLGEDVLVRRPNNRTAPRLVQPAFMPRPQKRPLPLLPEQAFDFNSMIPINPAITTEDPPPMIVPAQQSFPPLLNRPAGLALRFDEATEKILDAVEVQKRKRAKQDAQASTDKRLANLISPRARDAVPLAGSNGAVVQFKIVDMAPFVSVEDQSGAPAYKPKPSVWIQEPLPIARLLSRPKLPQGILSRGRGTTVVRELVSYDPQRAASQEIIRFIEAASRPTVPRPPSRRLRIIVLTTPATPSPTPVEGTQVGIVLTPEDGVRSQAAPQSPIPATIEPAPVRKSLPQIAGARLNRDHSSSGSAQTQLVAAAMPKLLLPRPPVRPDRATDVAALIRQLDPVSAPVGPVSKYAISTLNAPARRPAGLKTVAKRILEQRNSVSHQVALKQEPVPATPRDRLRIPSGTRVSAAATIKNGIALGDISLIGIYGTSKTRRALVRLPQGRYVQVSRGDRLSGWTVSVVSEDAVRITKGSKNKVLRLPN